MKMNGDRVVVYIGNPNVYGMMLSASKSLLFHTDVDRIYFLIEDDDFPGGLPPVYRCINVRNQPYFPPNCPNINPYYTYITMMRTVLPKLLPDESKVLLLDPDTLVRGCLDELFDTDITGYYFAAVQETRNHRHTKVPYFNAGVMLMNLDKFRDDGMDDRIIRELNRKYYVHIEQDVLNFLCDGEILKLPSKWNASHCTAETDDERIHHYLSSSKWMFGANAKQYERMTFEELLGGWKD